MISFVVCNEGAEVQIDCDDAGIDRLIEILTKLRGSGSHVHLWAPKFFPETDAYGELSNQSPYGQEAVSEVVISHSGD